MDYLCSSLFVKQLKTRKRIRRISVNRQSDPKNPDPTAETSALEAEIDQLINALYGLTAERIAPVEVWEE
ncbi:hypothetical protein GBK04_01535 [Cytophagaceae bacterium SJW1-29]|uniref:Uncharacterized protein n=1 Tax=Salmonirosea aquatica TaxID=2654236 RepID=A0A7C9BEZ1_9BACT|nr:hypothetical protein [Cytophagaceae bacterium SJW1-29]